jgi:hypothetical protein
VAWIPVFFSVFKWEQRKGWDVLLKAFLQEFSGADDVVLYLLINAYHSDTNFSRKIHRFVDESSIKEPLDGWAEIRIIDEHVPVCSSKIVQRCRCVCAANPW